jgi:hypothetical protein
VVRDEPAARGETHLAQAVDVAAGRGQRRDLVPPAGPEEPRQIGLQRVAPQQRVGHERAHHRVPAPALAGLLEHGVEEVGLPEQFRVRAAVELTRHQRDDERRGLGPLVLVLRRVA